MMLFLGLTKATTEDPEGLQRRLTSSALNTLKSKYSKSEDDSDDLDDDGEDSKPLRFSFNQIQNDKKFTTFWSWYSPWEVKQQCPTDKSEFNFCTSKNKNVAYQVLKRKATCSSKFFSFSFDVSAFWDDILDTMFDFSWGCKKKQRKGYGGWQNKLNYCSDGQYLDSKSKCQSCPIGCGTCLGPDQCNTCKKNFTSVEGYTFSYCFPDCPPGKYIQHLYTDDVSFCKKNNCIKRPQSMTPTMMSSQCESCPNFCDDCVFNEDTGRAFCYKCKRGFEFDDASGQCLLAECKEGEFRRKPMTASRTLSKSDNVEDYICRDCQFGCKTCKTNVSCDACKNYFVMSPATSTNPNIIKTCQPCPAFCKTCIPGANGKGVCTKCEENFNVTNNGTQCFLNRTCPLGQWFNDTRLSCQSCPSNCLTCKQGNLNGTVVCTSCSPDMFLDYKTMSCLDQCNRFRQFFSSRNGSCVTCPNMTYPDQTLQRCTPCSKNCDLCGFKVNTKISNIGFEVCTKCSNDSTYDEKRGKCRTQCNSTSIFNFNTMDCASCRPDYYKNKTEDSCKLCPNNCSSCESTPDEWKVNCLGCKTSTMMVVDWKEKMCRPKCSNPAHTFDFKSYSCKACPSNTLINNETQQCDPCPKGCTSCYRNTSTNLIECNKCELGLEIDKTKRLCRKWCPSWQTYYFETETCRECPPYQSYSYASKNCQPCDFGCINCFSRQSNKTKPSCIECGNGTVFDFMTWQCKLPCNDTTVFNFDTKTCDSCPQGKYLDKFWQKCYDCSTAYCSVCEKTNGFLDTCKQCKTGYTLDVNSINRAVCRQDCAENSYYNATRKTCIKCSSGQYYNSTSQKCTFCPTNCTTCSLSNGLVSCDACNSGYFLVGTPRRCRMVCSLDTPFYNATIDKCTTCPVGTYWSTTNRNCTSCPTNCQSCSYDQANNRVKCNSCLNNWILDVDVQQCKPTCPSDSQYDWNLKKCTVCPAGTWLNKTKVTCDACPSNCMSCSNVLGNLECTSCFSGFVVDRKQCRPACQYPSYFDWNIYQCRNCSTGLFLDPTSTMCAGCPVNCASCFYDFNLQSPSCDSCKSGTVLDPDQQRCKLVCSSTQFYDWGTNTCQSCSTGSFMIPGTGVCQNCPPGCTGCSYNTNTQTVQCSGCQNNLVLDQYQRQCRPACNSTSYFDWTRNGCVNCVTGTFLEPQSEKCVTCPSNCQSCFYNTSNQIECTTCSSGFQLERQSCRQTCNSVSYYDWSTGSCTECKTGSWLNPQTQSCQACDLGCSSCSASDLNPGLSQCSQCLPTLMLDQGFCRKVCQPNQFYDWAVSDCFNCTYPCLKCSNAQTCSLCDEMFNLQADGTCKAKCIDGQEFWNSVTKSCESIRKLTVSLALGTSKTIRCRNTTVSATPGGLLSGEVPSYSWSYQVTSGGLNLDKWKADIDAVMTQATQNNLQRIIIPSALTEKMNDNVNIRFSIQITVGKNQVSNSTVNTLLIEPHVFTTMTNYSSSYTIFASSGLPINLAFMYPECPVFKGPQAVPSTITISCSLYDSKGNLIKTLSVCGLQPNEVSSGLTYQIRYYYVPNPYQVGTLALRDSITVNTIAQQPSCSIVNSTLLYVYSTDTLQLKVNLINGRSTFVFQWSCNPLTSGANCGILQTTQNQPDLSMPASSLTVGGQYNYTLNIFDNQVFQTSCSATVEVVKTTPTTLTMSYLDGSDSRSYVDPAVQQNLVCYQSQESYVPLTFTWTIVRASNRSTVFSSSPLKAAPGITVANENMIIEKNSLSQDDYEITCRASNKKYSGSLVKTFTTSLRLKNVQVKFNVFPSSGRAQDTVFSLSVSKPPGQNLWCKFGYKTLNGGEISIFDSTVPTYPSSSQTLVTKLDRVIPQDIQMMFTNCYDSTNAYARDEFNVTVTPALTQTLTKSLNNLGKLLQGKGSFIQQNSIVSERPFEFSEILQTFSQIQVSNSTTDLAPIVENLRMQIKMNAFNFSAAEEDMLSQIFDKIITVLKNNKRQNSISKVLMAISYVLSKEGAQEQTTLDKDVYKRFINMILNELQKKTVTCEKLISILIKSIDIGALRVSGNLLANSQLFNVSHEMVEIKIVKLTSDKLKQSSIDRTELIPKWKNDFVEITVPYNDNLQNFQTIVILERVWNRELFNKDYMKSDIVDVDVYSSKYPISFDGKVYVDRIDMNSLKNSIQINFSGSSSLNTRDTRKGICSYFNEKQESWTKLNCQPTTMSCCSTHLTSFSLIGEEYYMERSKQESLKMGVSLIPSLILSFLVLASLYQARRKINYSSSDMKSVAQTSRADISPTKQSGQVTEQEISANKLEDVSQLSVDQIVIQDAPQSRLFEIFSGSKLGKLFQESCDDWTSALRTILPISIVLFGSFTLTSGLIQGVQEKVQIVFLSWFILAALEPILKVISQISQRTKVLAISWLVALCAITFVQPFVLVANVMSLSDASFSGWINSSAAVSLLNVIIQDFLIMPVGRSLLGKVFNK